MCNNRAVYEIMWKNTVERGRSQMAIWRMRIACWIPKATNTLRICYTYCFSTATMIARTRLNVTLYLYGLSCWMLPYTYTVCLVECYLIPIRFVLLNVTLYLYGLSCWMLPYAYTVCLVECYLIPIRSVLLNVTLYLYGLSCWMLNLWYWK